MLGIFNTTVVFDMAKVGLFPCLGKKKTVVFDLIGPFEFSRSHFEMSLF
jgi:hypothetical protein